MLVCSTSSSSGLACGGDGAVTSVGAVVGNLVVGKVASEGALVGGADPGGALGLG